MAEASSHSGLGRIDVARGRKSGTLRGLDNMGFSSLVIIPWRGKFFGDRKPCKREVVFPFWEHSVSRMW